MHKRFTWPCKKFRGTFSLGQLQDSFGRTKHSPSMVASPPDLLNLVKQLISFLLQGSHYRFSISLNYTREKLTFRRTELMFHLTSSFPCQYIRAIDTRLDQAIKTVAWIDFPCISYLIRRLPHHHHAGNSRNK